MLNRCFQHTGPKNRTKQIRGTGPGQNPFSTNGPGRRFQSHEGLPNSEQGKQSDGYEDQEKNGCDDQDSHRPTLLSLLGNGDAHEGHKHPEQIPVRIWRGRRAGRFTGHDISYCVSLHRGYCSTSMVKSNLRLPVAVWLGFGFLFADFLEFSTGIFNHYKLIQRAAAREHRSIERVTSLQQLKKQAHHPPRPPSEEPPLPASTKPKLLKKRRAETPMLSSSSTGFTSGESTLYVCG